MTTIATVAENGADSIVLLLALILCCVACAFLYRRHTTFRLHRHGSVCAVLALAMSATVFVATGSTSLSASPLAEPFAQGLFLLLEMMLLTCWSEVLLLLTARQSAHIVGQGFIVLGGINALSAMVAPGRVEVGIAFFPVLSLICLYWFKDRAAMLGDLLGDGGGEVPPAFYFDRSLIPAPTEKDGLASLLNFLLPVAVFPIVFGYLHFSWLSAQDGGLASLLIQLSAAAGTALGGGLVLVLCAAFWGRRKIALYNLFTLLVITLAFALVGVLPAQMPYPYIILLNIAQKSVIFMVWMMPFLLARRLPPMSVWFLAYSLYQAGRVVAMVSLAAFGLQGFALVSVAAAIVLISSLVLGVVVDQGKRDYSELSDKPVNDATRTVPLAEIDNTSPRGTDTTCDRIGENDDMPTDRRIDDAVDAEPGGRTVEEATGLPGHASDEILARVCASLATDYRLSLREEEVLRLVSTGMVARDIAETLVVSNSTAKTHMRNLYAKLDAHSQTEIVLMVNQRAQELA